MKYFLCAVFALCILFIGCRADYDISEVAPDEYLGEDHDHDHDNSHDEADHHEEGTGDIHSDHEVSSEHDLSEIAGSERHVHEAGVRNHGTEWFFNQPWAATFIWGKMLRDSLILLFLAAAIILVSSFRRKRR